MKLLLDPHIIVIADEQYENRPMESKHSYWDRIIRWSTDNRVRLGPESHALISGHFSEFGYPANEIDPALPHIARECSTAVNRLLSRVMEPNIDSREIFFTPKYLGSANSELALKFDLTSFHAGVIAGIASVESHWDVLANENCTLRLTPPPPSELELCFCPGAFLQSEQSEKLRNILSKKILTIVGGKRNNNVINEIFTKYRIPKKNIHWIESEKAKPPRNIDGKWSQSDPEKHIILCVTGRIGHAGFYALKSEADKNDIPFIYEESQSRIVDRVGAYSSEIQC